MKTLSKVFLGLGIACTMSLAACSGSYYVADRPVEPVYARPAAPYADAYWVPGEWNWNGGRYVYTNGYYVHRRVGYTYAPGYWRQGPRGHVWVRGRWRR
ncbi:YXWGXW repeat-containing protein [Mucilaginibacter ginkgonis]|uniref:YXWGXW repeat-containing protein n=1 Tax=Mucilaginibacter ginkgonis TaxID=2682091 RepID=A0A6I4IMG1_9SPHI|nr:YXWGXW repeat-containing protein [Mucilaginibacter ginkgonis]QQL50400.1 YXWGXW repeat-containing protein [Mucilaginibacter ginkgonis]